MCHVHSVMMQIWYFVSRLMSCFRWIAIQLINIGLDVVGMGQLFLMRFLVVEIKFISKFAHKETIYEIEYMKIQFLQCCLISH